MRRSSDATLASRYEAWRPFDRFTGERIRSFETSHLPLMLSVSKHHAESFDSAQDVPVETWGGFSTDCYEQTINRRRRG